jgi:hypothetical protein
MIIMQPDAEKSLTFSLGSIHTDEELWQRHNDSGGPRNPSSEGFDILS